MWAQINYVTALKNNCLLSKEKFVCTYYLIAFFLLIIMIDINRGFL